MSAEPIRGGRAAFVVLFVVAAAARIALALQPGLWCDEIFSLAMATGHSLEHPAAIADPARGDYVEPRRPVSALEFRRYLVDDTPPASAMRVVRAVLFSDTSPPAYYLLLAAWQRAFGASDAALRAFSVTCGLAALVLLWSLARALGGPRVAIFAALLFTAAPPALYYSVEGRMYALTWLLGLALAHLSLRLARDGSARAVYAVAWVAIAATGLLTHYFFAFGWLAMTAWLFAVSGRGGRVRVVAMVVAVGALIAPWYVQLPTSLGAWRVTGRWLDTPLGMGQLAYGVFRLGGSLVNSWGVWRGSKLTIPVQAVILAALGVAVLRRGAGPLLTSERRLVLFWLAAAVIGPVVLDALRGTAMSRIERYALPGLPAAMVVFALALDHVFRPAGLAVLVATLIAWVPGLREVARSSPRYWEPFPTIAADLAGWTGPEDLVIVSSIPSGVLGVARYVDPATPLVSWVEPLATHHMPAAAEALTAGRCRVALVRTHDLGVRAAIEPWLRAHAASARDLTLYDEDGVQSVITYFTLHGPDGRCATRSSRSRAPAAIARETPSRPAARSGG
jgi:hypothetical protein